MKAPWEYFRNVFRNLKIFDFFGDNGAHQHGVIRTNPKVCIFVTTFGTEKIKKSQVSKNISKILPRGFHLPPDPLKSVYGARSYPAAKLARFHDFHPFS